MKVIAHCRQPGNTIASTAKYYAISDQTLRNWINKGDERKRSDRLRVLQLEKELAETKRRLANMELTNEILSKATAIIASSKQA
jgi:transposase-like protein